MAGSSSVPNDWAKEWLVALDLRKFQIRENEAQPKYRNALEMLVASGAVEISIERIGDTEQLDDVRIVATASLEQATIDLLSEVVRSGAYSIAGLATAVAALGCLASTSPTKGTAQVEELRSELFEIVMDCPKDDIGPYLKDGKLAEALHQFPAESD